MRKIWIALSLCLAAVACSNSTPEASPPQVDVQYGSTGDAVIEAGIALQQIEQWLTSQTTTTAITPDVMPSTTPPAYAGPVSDDCWVAEARAVGWPENTLGTLQRIIRRESGCDPSAFADRPSTLDNSRGLMQINAWGNLAQHIRNVCGVEPDQLFDPIVNLECGLIYYNRSGWAPWGGGA